MSPEEQDSTGVALDMAAAEVRVVADVIRQVMDVTGERADQAARRLLADPKRTVARLKHLLGED